MLTTGFCATTATSSPLLAMAGGGVNIDFDRTFLVQMVLFITLVVVLKPLLFDPILKVFELREERTDGARKSAREMQEKAGELLQRYEREIERVNQVAAVEREKLRSETAKLEAEILTEAREATGKIIEEGRARIDKEVSSIRFDLGRQSERVARELAVRVLGREVQ